MYAEPSKRELHLIPTGPHGNAVEYISQFIDQGRIYIRPIQCDIDLNAIEAQTDPLVLDEICNWYVRAYGQVEGAYGGKPPKTVVKD